MGAVMLDFADEPFRWYPPRRSPLVGPFLRVYNHRWHLPRVRAITAVQPRGYGSLRAGLRGGDRVVFMPNHSTHSDASIFLDALRQVRMRTHMMAAYDVFLRGERTAWMMQRLGAFSVDRDAADARPMKQAMATLERGRHALTVFPEGNVYLENDRVGPFLEGAAFIALRAQSAIKEDGARVLAVPVAIKATFVEDVRDAVWRRLERVAEAVEVPMDRDDPLESLRGVGLAAMRRNLRHRGIDCPEGGALPETIRCAAASVLERLESKLGITPRDGDGLIDRVRQCRRVIHEVRVNPDRAADHAAAAGWADEAMIALRIVSYRGDYVADRPTLDRVAETVEKLEEDVFGLMPEPVGRRHAVVQFAEAIDLRDTLAQHRKLRAGVREVTAAAERAVQDGLDQINRENPHAGGDLWEPHPGV